MNLNSLRNWVAGILLALALVGCEQQKVNTDSQSHPIADTGDQSANTATGNNSRANDASDIDNGSLVETNTTPLKSNGALNDTELEKDKTSSKSLVEDLGFSGLENNTSTPQAQAQFCLGKQSSVNELSLEQACNKISKRLASVSMNACSAANLKPSGCLSVKGFPILVREFAPLKNKAPQGRILVIGGTHGDELTSVSVTFRWIDKLNKYHSGLFHWHIAPMMNPDGVLKRAASRTNHNGVDLNRNMPTTDWDSNALAYWETKGSKNPRKFPGEQASSEPETQWLIDEINSFKPDAIISVHAPYGVVDFDSLLLNTAPKNLGKLHLNLLGTYPGSLGNYAGINRNIPVITLELPHAWEMPTDKETTKIWEDIVSWLTVNVQGDTTDVGLSN